MVRASEGAGGKGKAAAGTHDDGVPDWCNVPSVLDLTNASLLSVTPPIALYLEEVSMGMYGGVGDHAQHSPIRGKRAEALLRVLLGDAACCACRALFWLAISGIFGRAPETSLSSFRCELGESWHLLCLAIPQPGPGGNRELTDWLLAAFPFVFAQTIYRLMCDAFVDDRKNFIVYADNLVLKLSLLTHFELTGFQLTADSVRKARRRLFLQRVVKSPHINQREYLRGQRRQVTLESQNTLVGDRPLKFPSAPDDHALDETQLDHVMQGRTEARKRQQKNAPASRPSQTPTQEMRRGAVVSEDNVERYVRLSVAGTELYGEHVMALAACLGEDAEEDAYSVEASDESASPPSPCSTRASGLGASARPTSWSPSSSVPASPATAGGAPGSTWRNQASSDEGEGGDEMRGDGESSPSGDPSSPALRRSKSVTWTKSMSAVVRFSMIKERGRGSREEEARARKAKQDKLQVKITKEPLPSELCERELCTTWVSPAMKSLVPGAADRLNVLQKTSAEAFRLKMATTPMPVRPLSMPALRTKEAAHNTRRRPPDTVTVSQTSGKDDGSLCGGGGNRSLVSACYTAGTGGAGRTTASEMDTSVAGGPGASTGTFTVFPRVASASGTWSGGAMRTMPGGEHSEPISMEPPTRLSGKVIMQRLEGQAKAFRSTSFASYMKEYDVFSGTLKMCFDEKRLRDEEDAYLRKLDGMVGGKPKRMIFAHSMQRPRHGHSMKVS